MADYEALDKALRQKCERENNLVTAAMHAKRDSLPKFTVRLAKMSALTRF